MTLPKYVVELLEMTQCPYKNVSLIFSFLKCCADMSRRPEERSDRLRLGRVQSSTNNTRRENDALRPPLLGRNRGKGGHETW